jgi:hypothetical protein
MALELLNETPESLCSTLEGLPKETLVEKIVQVLTDLYAISTAEKDTYARAYAKRCNTNELSRATWKFAKENGLLEQVKRHSNGDELSRAIWKFAEENDLLEWVERHSNDHPLLPDQSTRTGRGKTDRARYLKRIEKHDSWKGFLGKLQEVYKTKKEFGNNLLVQFGQLAAIVDFGQALKYFEKYSVDTKGKKCGIGKRTLDDAIEYFRPREEEHGLRHRESGGEHRKRPLHKCDTARDARSKRRRILHSPSTHKVSQGVCPMYVEVCPALTDGCRN